MEHPIIMRDSPEHREIPMSDSNLQSIRESGGIAARPKRRSSSKEPKESKQTTKLERNERRCLRPLPSPSSTCWAGIHSSGSPARRRGMPSFLIFSSETLSLTMSSLPIGFGLATRADEPTSCTRIASRLIHWYPERILFLSEFGSTLVFFFEYWPSSSGQTEVH